MADNELEKWLKENPEFDLKKEEEIQKKIYKSKKEDEIPEIDLHGLILAKAFAKVAQFMRSQPEKIKKIRIIHGKGIHSNADQSGVLREEIRKWLTTLKNKKELVKDFRYEDAQNGGWGVTLVWLVR